MMARRPWAWASLAWSLAGSAIAAAGDGKAADAVAAQFPAVPGGPVSVPVTSLKALRYRTTVRQQYDYSCGSAAIATLLTYHYGHPVAEQQAFDAMLRGGDAERIRREGFSLLDMKRYLATQGYAADGFRQSLDTLAAAGLPAIVLVAEGSYHHFVVVKGVRDGRVLLGDPSGGTRSMPRRAFDAIWRNGLLFVIHDRPERPRFNDEYDWAAAPRMRPGDALVRDNLQWPTLSMREPGGR